MTPIKRVILFLINLAFLLLPCINVTAQGAITPFTTYEAESGILEGGAIILSMTTLPGAPTVQLESSGRKCVELKSTGASISWKTTDTVNAIVVRVSIPDAPEGGGIDASLDLYVDGIFRQTLKITSKYSWVYGVNNFKNNDPSIGTPKRFYDSYRTFISGEVVASESTITLKKNESNNASYYHIDLIQLEYVGPALPQPDNTLSVLSYGAISNDDADDSQAFKSCIADCQQQGKGMWIPAGIFHTSGIISAKGISIYGAGMWYSTNYRIIGARHKWDLTNCTIQDIYIENPEVAREMAFGHDYGMTVQGADGWMIQRVWVHRGGACFWCSGTDGIIKDCRATESWADGINLNNGPNINPEKRGFRLSCQNNYILGATDDGIAINSQNGGDTTWNMVDTKVINNTSIAVIWANGIRIAGGRNSMVKNNYITDPTDSNGIRIGKFGANGNPCESVLVADNLILRGCGIRSTYGHAGITVADGANATLNDNIINDSPGIGIEVQSSTATYSGNIVNRPTLNGFLIQAGAMGAGTFTNNVVNELNAGQLAFTDKSFDNFTIVSFQNSWDIPVSGISVTPSMATINVGDFQWLTAIIVPSDAFNKNVSWFSSNDSIATVNQSGLVNALKEGTATIFVTTEDGEKKDSAMITVTSINTGLSEEKNTFNENMPLVTIYPNPLNQDLLSIDLEGFEDLSAIEITITNLRGQTVYSNTIQYKKQLEISTNSLSKNSIYVITVKSHKTSFVSKLIIL